MMRAPARASSRLMSTTTPSVAHLKDRLHATISRVPRVSIKPPCPFSPVASMYPASEKARTCSREALPKRVVTQHPPAISSLAPLASPSAALLAALGTHTTASYDRLRWPRVANPS